MPPSTATRRHFPGGKFAGKAQVHVLSLPDFEGVTAEVGPYADTARLLQGRLDVTVNPKLGPANALLIYGPRRTTVMVSGGRAAVVVSDKGVAVGLYEGKDAAVGIGATWKHITAGEMMVVSADHPEGLASRLPPMPTQVTVARPVIAVQGLGDPSRAVWQKLSDTVRYRVTLRDTTSDQSSQFPNRRHALRWRRA